MDISLYMLSRALKCSDSPFHHYLSASSSPLHFTTISLPHHHPSTSPLSLCLIITPPLHHYLSASSSPLHFTTISLPHHHPSNSPLSLCLIITPPLHHYLSASSSPLHLTTIPPPHHYLTIIFPPWKYFPVNYHYKLLVPL